MLVPNAFLLTGLAVSRLLSPQTRLKQHFRGQTWIVPFSVACCHEHVTGHFCVLNSGTAPPRLETEGKPEGKKNVP